MNMATRLKKELQTLKKLGPDSLIGAYPAEDNDPRHLVGWIKGPDDTPYEDGVFLVDIILPEQYPFAAPKMKFITRVWHPNVSSVTGAICLDTLKSEWTPALGIRTSLLSVLSLLTDANPGDPQDHVVAGEYVNSYDKYLKTAREWTEQHAKQNLHLYKGARTKGTSPNAMAPPKAPAPKPLPPCNYPNQLKVLLDMGFPEESARVSIEKARGDIDSAVTQLTS